jgi:hypothetical protein
VPETPATARTGRGSGRQRSRPGSRRSTCRWRRPCGRRGRNGRRHPRSPAFRKPVIHPLACRIAAAIAAVPGQQPVAAAPAPAGKATAYPAPSPHRPGPRRGRTGRVAAAAVQGQDQRRAPRRRRAGRSRTSGRPAGPPVSAQAAGRASSQGRKDQRRSKHASGDPPGPPWRSSRAVGQGTAVAFTSRLSCPYNPPPGVRRRGRRAAWRR